MSENEIRDERSSAPPKSSETKKEEPKQADVVIQIVSSLAVLFHDERHNTYATVEIGDGGDGVYRRTMKLRSRAFRQWCAFTVRQSLGFSVGASSIDEALVVLEGIAKYDRPEETTHVRAARIGDVVYIDLAEEKTADVIEVTPTGWKIVSECPVRFLRPSGIKPLVRPKRGGNAGELRRFLNVRKDDDFSLVVGWLLGALGNPGSPNPILGLSGEHGSAKSTATRIVRSLVDPSAADLRTPPRNEDGLAVAANASYVVALDNLSSMQGWLSDCLCRVVTGGALTKRTLYTDEDETILQLKRPVILNGIEDIATRPDLADRTIVVMLHAIDRASRRSEREICAAFEKSAPGILGALLDGVSRGLRPGAMSVDDLDRMADWLSFVTACEEGLGFKPRTIASAYRRNRTTASDIAFESSVVALAVRDLMDARAAWSGSASDLLEALSELETVNHRAPDWPKTASQLGGQLRRDTPSLRAIGIEVTASTEGRDKEKRRVIRIECATPSPVSPHTTKSNGKGVSGDGGDSGDDANRNPSLEAT